MNINIAERIFRKKLIRDLEHASVNVINLGNGTFDLIIEGNRPYVVEIKKMLNNVLSTYDPIYKGFGLTEIQFKEISKMNFPPIIIAFNSYKNENYIISPDWIKKEIKYKLNIGKIIVTKNSPNFPKPVTYKKLIQKILIMINL